VLGFWRSSLTAGASMIVGVVGALCHDGGGSSQGHPRLLAFMSTDQ
jgi:hypothetical protein